MKSIEEIQKAVADKFHLSVKELISPSKDSTIVIPRQISIILCHEAGHTNQSEIERKHNKTGVFGNSLISFNNILVTSEFYRQSIRDLRTELKIHDPKKAIVEDLIIFSQKLTSSNVSQSKLALGQIIINIETLL